MELQNGVKIVANARTQSTSILYTGSECVKVEYIKLISEVFVIQALTNLEIL